MAAVTGTAQAAAPFSTLESVQNLKNTLVVAFQNLSKESVISEKTLTSLEELHGRVRQLSTSCDEVVKASNDRVNGLVWWQRFLEKLAYFCFLSLGKYASTLYSLQTVRAEIVAQTRLFSQKEFQKLDEHNKNPNFRSLYYVRLYDLLVQFRPEDKGYLNGMADRLIIEGAYNAAIHALESYAKAFPNKEQTIKHKIIFALKGAKKYPEAYNAIMALKVELSKQAAADPIKTAHARSYLENLKIDCLVEEKKYQEAKNELCQLIKELPHQPLLKTKMVQTTILDELSHELAKANVDSVGQQRFFFARAKKLFGLDNNSQSAWQENLGSDFDFWLSILTTQLQVYDNEKLLNRVIDEIKELIECKMISPATVFNGLGSMMTRMQHETDLFNKQYHAFLNETAKDLPLQQEIKKEITDSRLQILKERLYGSSGMESFAGILPMMGGFYALCDILQQHEDFSNAESKTKFQTFRDALTSSRSTLVQCGRSLKQVYDEGFHPYINALKQTVGDAETLLQLTV